MYLFFLTGGSHRAGFNRIQGAGLYGFNGRRHIDHGRGGHFQGSDLAGGADLLPLQLHAALGGLYEYFLYGAVGHGQLHGGGNGARAFKSKRLLKIILQVDVLDVYLLPENNGVQLKNSAGDLYVDQVLIVVVIGLHIAHHLCFVIEQAYVHQRIAGKRAAVGPDVDLRVADGPGVGAVDEHDLVAVGAADIAQRYQHLVDRLLVERHRKIVQHLLLFLLRKAGLRYPYTYTEKKKPDRHNALMGHNPVTEG